MKITTFGYRYKRSAPIGADVIIDARCLKEDPAEKATLGHLTGQDDAVKAYLHELPDVRRFVHSSFGAALPSVTELAIGCHSGRHRSVYVAEQVARMWLHVYGVAVQVEHLDMLRQPDEDLAPDYV